VAQQLIDLCGLSPKNMEALGCKLKGSPLLSHHFRQNARRSRAAKPLSVTSRDGQQVLDVLTLALYGSPFIPPILQAQFINPA